MPAPGNTRWYRQLYFWVLVAIAAGIVVGWLAPVTGVAMEPLGATFVTAMKMLIGPIVFLTIVGGIAGVADLRKVGLTGVKALAYFQAGTIVAMVTGLLAINVCRLGEGVNADPGKTPAVDSVPKPVTGGNHVWELLTHLVPGSVVGPFVDGNVLQIIFLAVLFGVALNAVGQVGGPVLDAVNRLTAVVFKVLSYLMKLAPVGAFGAMAFAAGGYGVHALTSLAGLILLFYVTSALFVVVVLGSVMAYLRLNIFHLLGYLRAELLLVLGTSSAEPALPGLMRKLEQAGVSAATVRLIVPTGYAFNLDGAAIYLSLAAVYVAQATNTRLSVGAQIGLLAVMLLTSKGAAGTAGAGSSR
ncbi:C4-dicarboxylate transport protein [Mycobacterium kansasii 662]|uniref:C4-dicarboxylate transport protein n=1 Tax=Mycobacterium kansasii 662 TaxID=1299326 RepID=X7YT44_MYCKA|nr:C4-dicarboxylate transport protein [Mycobacterium kansasii 662]